MTIPLLSTISNQSGTTGQPKGAMLSHDNVSLLCSDFGELSVVCTVFTPLDTTLQ